MKLNFKIFALAIVATLFFSQNVTAQWTFNATSIYPTILTKNVGIGTNAPEVRLHVKGNTQVAKFESTSSGNFVSFFTSGGNKGYVGINYSNDDMDLGTGSSTGRVHLVTNLVPRLTVGSTGNVGIGIQNPNGRLQFENGNDNRKIVLHQTANNFHQFYGFGIGDNAMRYQVSQSVSSHIFYAGSSTTSSLELMRIKGTGEVGIGTASPSARLHVSGVENTGVNAPLKITSGTQNMLIDGNEIDALQDALCLNYNNSGNVLLAMGGGKVGIGTNDLASSYKLRVNGNAYATGIWQSSDKRYKDNILTLGNALGKVLALRGTEYTLRTEEYKNMNFDSGKQVGFIAQEMQTVMPELVNADENGMLAINYIGVIPVLVEALKEQNTVIEEKETRIAALEAQNNELKDRLARIEAALGIAATERQEVPAAVTATISPNPTSGIVTISLKNSTSAKSVTVKVLDSTGREIASRSAAGEGSVQFDLSQFPAGVYVAQVVADGKMVSANKVQLVK